MTITEACSLGLLQGIAEFLPISSSGHLTLLGAWLELSEDPVALNLTLHLATLLVIVIYYRRRIFSLLFPLHWDYLKAIVITSVPTAILGLGIKKGAGFVFEDARISVVLLILNGFALIALTLLLRRQPATALQESQGETETLPNVRQALVIGVVQGLAALPGISRSGSTIGSARLMGIPAKQAAEYSLLASIPVISGAALLECRDLESFESLNSLLWGSLVAVISGWFAVGLLLKIVDKNAWIGWGIYCIGAGTLYGVIQYG